MQYCITSVMKKIIPAVILLVSIVQNIYSQTDTLTAPDSLAVTYSDTLPPKTIWKNFKHDAGSIGGAFIFTLTQPARWKKDDLYKFAGTVAAVGLLYTVDGETSRFFRKQKEDAPTLMKDFGWYFGSPQNNYGLTTSVYLAGLFTNHEKLRRTGVLMITSASVSGLIQQVAKSVTGRARPDTEYGKNHFRPFGGSSGYRSFPSGHTVLSVTTMYALSKQFENPWIKAACYTVGAIPPVTRLWEGAHWLTDVVLSGIISVAVVEGVDRYLDEKRDYGKKDGMPVQPPKRVSWNLRAGPTTVGIVGVF
jgi:membrane-associated phospholipid phosphatase